MPEYPWYEIVNGDDIEQGDVLGGCPVYFPPADLNAANPGSPPQVVEFEWTERDVIVLTQSCDLFKGREKMREVLLCAIWSCDEVGGHLSTEKGKEDAHRGNLPAYHMLAGCDLPGFESSVAVVDFRRIYSLPVSHFRQRAIAAADRLRLLPPYREHLAQSFARFFMRVGLPIDIPPFR